jgi:hypothetical protein
MAKPNLSRLDFDSLMNLRKQVDEMLLKRRADIETQLGRITSLSGERATRGRRRGGSPIRGRKVPPKYRSRSGETWELDDFLIDKSARKIRRKRTSKR